MFSNGRFLVGFSMFFIPLSHGTHRFSNVCRGARGTRDLVYNATFVLFFCFVLRMDMHGPNGVERSVENGDSMIAKNALQFFGKTLDVGQAYGGMEVFFSLFGLCSTLMTCRAGWAL